MSAVISKRPAVIFRMSVGIFENVHSYFEKWPRACERTFIWSTWRSLKQRTCSRIYFEKLSRFSLIFNRYIWPSIFVNMNMKKAQFNWLMPASDAFRMCGHTGIIAFWKWWIWCHPYRSVDCRQLKTVTAGKYSQNVVLCFAIYLSSYLSLRRFTVMD